MSRWAPRTAVVAVLLGLLAGCGGSDETADRGSAERGADPEFSPPPLTTGESDDPAGTPAETSISYDGRLAQRPSGPGSASRQQLGVFCAEEAGPCNVTGLSVGNHPVLELGREGAGSFVVDLPASASTCEQRGTSAVTGTVELGGRTMTLALRVSGETVACPGGDIVYEPGSYRFTGEYVDGGLPGFTVE